jgi:hypothetical protein
MTASSRCVLERHSHLSIGAAIFRSVLILILLKLGRPWSFYQPLLSVVVVMMLPHQLLSQLVPTLNLVLAAHYTTVQDADNTERDQTPGIPVSP